MTLSYDFYLIINLKRVSFIHKPRDLTYKLMYITVRTVKITLKNCKK